MCSRTLGAGYKQLKSCTLQIDEVRKQGLTSSLADEIWWLTGGFDERIGQSETQGVRIVVKKRTSRCVVVFKRL